MSNRPGLDALLPKNQLTGHEPLWTYVFRTNQRGRMFNGSIDFLPFDPDGRMVYIGSVRQIEHAFLILVPRNQVGRAASDVGTKVYKKIAPIDRVQNGPPWGLGTTVPQIWTPKSAGTPEV